MDERPSLLPVIIDLGFSTAKQLEEVQARQLIYGGDQELNLVELRLVTEAQLLAAMSLVHALAAAAPGYINADSELTSQLRGAGINAAAGFGDAGDVSVYFRAAPSEETKQLVEVVLGPRTQFYVTSPMRLDEAIFDSEGEALPPRLERLLKRLGRRPKADVTVPVPQVSAVTPPALPAEQPAEQPVESPPISVEADEAHLTPAKQPAPIQETGPPPRDYEELAKKASSSGKAQKPIAGSAAPRHSYSVNEAAKDLTLAKSRERVIDIFVHFSAQFFEYTAVFAILSKEAKGLKSSGDGARSAEVEKLKIPLDLQSAFREVQSKKTHRVGRLKASGLEGGIARDLGRPTGRDMFLLPILVKGRTVVLLWGDNGRENVSLSELGNLFSFAQFVSEALERVLVDKLRASRVANPVDIAPRVQPAAPSEPAAPREAPDLHPDVSLGQPKRRHTQRNSAAPAASFDTPPVPPASEPVRAPESALEEVPAKKRTLGGAGSTPPGAHDSEPPQSFPEPPKTLQGFPHLKTPSQVASEYSATIVQTRNEPGPRAPLLSRRIVPLGELSGQHSSAPPPAIPKPESFEDSPVSAFADVATAEPEAPPAQIFEAPLPPLAKAPVQRGTLMSRRAPISEPDESGWGGPKEILVRPVAKVRTQADLAKNFSELVSAYLAGDESALVSLMEGGETAVGALIARFPGPVSEPVSADAPASSCGPLLSALVQLGSISTAFLTVRTADEDPHVRRWATYLLGELPGKEAANAIAHRLLDDSPLVRRAALASARRAQKDILTRRTLRSNIEALCRDTALSIEARCSAIEALADVREHESIPMLLQLLDSKDKALFRATRWALCVLTRQDFGDDVRAWRNFWQEHRDESRVEWLIRSLAHDNRDLRKAAGDELRSLAGTDFGFDEDQAEPARRQAQAAFRQWWDDTGHKI